MDMLKNDSKQINLNYTGDYAWGKLQARAYNEHTKHYMNFLADKLQISNPAGMPMDTDGKNTGFSVKGDVILSERDTLRVGAESQRYRMSDWWSPISPIVVAPMTGMKGGVFQNINNGQRDRLALFAEMESRWSSQWLSQLGLRSETVKMNTGTVKGYNTTNYPAATYAAFNAMNRQKSDSNIDITALSRYTPDERKTFEFGFAQKTRSPNLYERFAWSANNTMVLNMNNWVGDGNGYVGNIDLKPEVAHTLSVSGNWHDAAQQDWDVKFAPYYTRVQNYIDAVVCTATATHPACPARADGFASLSLANQTARLYGADVSGKMSLVKASEYGSFSATGALNYVNGKNLTTGGNLYNIMPVNVKLAVEQRSGNWTNILEARLVDAKTNVEAVRREIKTGGYGLLNLYSSYEWKQMRFDLGVENLLNKFYANPLGGAYVGQGNTMSTGAPYGIAVPGMGRSINAGMTVKF
jgi:iron complex outermembrane receptor protein